jgi:hypothetical protein
MKESKGIQNFTLFLSYENDDLKGRGQLAHLGVGRSLIGKSSFLPNSEMFCVERYDWKARLLVFKIIGLYFR